RVHEVGAIAQLKSVNTLAVAAKGVAGGAMDVGKGAVSVVTHPVETVTGVGDGIGRLFGRIGRGAKRTGEKLGDDTYTPDSQNLSAPPTEKAPTESTAGKVGGAVGGTALDIIGVNAAVRSWAKKVRVDPYTRNQVLHDELHKIAEYDAGGRFSINL